MISGTNASTGDYVTLAQITSNKLTYAPVGNENGDPYTTFTFQVEDDGGTSNGGVNLDQSANTMTIDVTSVNDGP